MLRKIVKRITELFTARVDAENSAGNSPRASHVPPALPDDDLRLEELSRNFSSELFARLLIELPSHRQAMATAYKLGNNRHLRDSVHQLLGAVAYCDTPELETGLRELRLALQNDQRETIDYYYDRAINVIDDTLRFSGYRES